MSMYYSVCIRGKVACEEARDIVIASHNRIKWQGGFDSPLDCKFEHIPHGTPVTMGQLTCLFEHFEALEGIAYDASKYWLARGKRARGKAAELVRSALKEKRLNIEYLSSFATEGSV